MNVEVVDRHRHILLASNNPHKLSELRAMLEPAGFSLIAPAELGITLEPAESGTTFAANAVAKAETFADVSGMPSLADDSGLVVDALGGEPGVLSARYGGPGLTDAGRTRLVLAKMTSVPDNERSARFVAVIALAVPGVPSLTFEGVAEGRLAHEPAGSGGFGYDPIFFFPPAGKTFAQLAPEEKHAVSHRGRAVQALLAHLTSLPLVLPPCGPRQTG